MFVPGTELPGHGFSRAPIGRSCALLDDGSARCWGSNTDGSLGHGVLTDSNTPVPVSIP
jgi:hypothetical protein